jgi:hypothetical protein
MKTSREAGRAFRAAFKCYDEAAARAGITYLDRAVKLLPPNYMVVRFTAAEARMMKKARALTGWNDPEGVLFVRFAALYLAKGIVNPKTWNAKSK